MNNDPMDDFDPIFPSTSLSVIAPHPTTAPTSLNSSTSANAAAPPIQETELDSFNPQHLLLPLSNISRLMKSSVPLDAKISNASKALVQNCVSEFISFLTSDANEQVVADKRRTLNGVDLICAVKRLGFEGYYEALQIYLAKYRTVANETGKRHRRPRADDDLDDDEIARPSKRTKPGSTSLSQFADRRDAPDDLCEDDNEDETQN